MGDHRSDPDHSPLRAGIRQHLYYFTRLSSQPQRHDDSYVRSRDQLDHHHPISHFRDHQTTPMMNGDEHSDKNNGHAPTNKVEIDSSIDADEDEFFFSLVR